MTHTGIAVLESIWWKGRNTSVRGLFDLVADIASENPHAYHYEMGNCEAAIKEAVPRIGADRRIKYLYVASHGDEDGIHLHNEEKVSRTEFRNKLEQIKKTRGSALSGIYFGSCLFGTDKMANFLFSRSIAPNWIAGYSKEIGWIQSSALDLLFFNELLSEEKETETQRIHRVADKLRDIAPGLISELGFGIFLRKQGFGGAKNLFEGLVEED